MDFCALQITFLTTATTIMCGICLLSLLITIILEMTVYGFEDMNSFFVEQFVFRFLEVITDAIILYFLRKQEYRHSEERVPLVE